MRPETNGPWRKATRRALRGQPGRRPVKAAQYAPVYRGSTWLRRHNWMDPAEAWAIYQQRVTRPS